MKIIKIIKLFFILLFAIGFSFAKDSPHILQGISSPVKFIEQDFDVLSYNAELKFSDLPNKLLNANNEISFIWKNKTDSSKFYFHLRGLSVDSTFYDGLKVTPIIIGDTTKSDYHYEINPPKSNLKDSVTIKIYYSGAMTNEGKLSPWGGVHYDDSLLYALGVGFLNNYVGTTQHWLACYDHPSDKATFKLRFIVPTGNYVASGGDCTISYPDNGTDIFDYEISQPTATYLLTFNIGKLNEVKFEGSEIPVSVFCDWQDTNMVKYSFKLVPEMVNFFRNTFGEYPFRKVGYVLTKKGSMESQEMVNYFKSLAWSLYSKKDSTNLTAAHELSHMWFGNSVTPFDFRDAWLNESWATFSESLWREHLAGLPSYLNEQESKINLYFNNIVKIEGVIPLFDYPRTSAQSNYPTTIYYKGAVVVGMLRHKLGDSIFFRGLQAFQKKYKYSNMNTEALQSIFEQLSSQNLDQFFNQWIYSPGWPKIKATLTYKDIQNGEYIADKLRLEQIKTEGWGYEKGGYFLNFPLEVTFKRKDGSQTDTLIWINGDIKELNVDNWKIYNIQLNKGSKLRTLMQTISINYEKDVSVEEIRTEYKHFLSNRTLFLRFDENADFTIKIYNLFGSEVLCEATTHNEFAMNLHILPPGFYNFVIFKNNMPVFKNKIILN